MQPNSISGATIVPRATPQTEFAATSHPPALGREHVKGARLYADRRDLIIALDIREGGIVAEVGVALGDFSEFLLDQLRPKQFVAFDLFNLHEAPLIWGQPAEVLFKGMTQSDFYKGRFSDRGDQVVVEKGPSSDSLARYPDRFF